MRNYKSILTAFLMLVVFNLSAQMSKDSIVQKMKYFEFMLGEWEGEANISSPTGKEMVNQHEHVEYNLSGAILQVEGTGTNEKGEVVFNAFAIIFYDQYSNQFKLNAFKDDGQMTEATIEIVGPGEFIWRFSSSTAAHIEYYTKISNGIWSEDGKFSADKENWFPFFNMELVKLK